MARILGLGGGIFLTRIVGLGGRLFLVSIDNRFKSEVPPGRFLPLSSLISSSSLLLLLSSALLLFLASILPLLIC